MGKYYLSFILFCFSAVLAGKPRVNYGALPIPISQYGLYSHIERNAGIVYFGLWQHGLVMNQAESEAIRAEIVAAITQWASAIDWPYKNPTVIWENSTRSYKLIVNAYINRSYAEPTNGIIQLAYSQRDYRATIILHEIGHLVGLADMYVEVNQPPSIMNYLYYFTVLQPDDIIGARALYSHVKYGQPFCVAGYYESLGVNGARLCVPY